MDGRANMNAPDDASTIMGNKDNTMAPKIPEAFLAAFLSALTDAIITAVATAVSAVQPVPTLRYSTAINLFDTKSMDLTVMDGRGKWYKATEKTGG